MKKFLILGALLLGLLLPAASASASSLQTGGTCNGKAATKVATSATITGVHDNEVIIANGKVVGTDSFTGDFRQARNVSLCVWYAGGTFQFGPGVDWLWSRNLNAAKWYTFTITDTGGYDTFFVGEAGPHSRIDCGVGRGARLALQGARSVQAHVHKLRRDDQQIPGLTQPTQRRHERRWCTGGSHFLCTTNLTRTEER